MDVKEICFTDKESKLLSKWVLPKLWELDHWIASGYLSDEEALLWKSIVKKMSKFNQSKDEKTV